MEPQVAFYRLSSKVVNNQDAIPEDARQVMYYSLAIGHHVGVMDCLSELMAVPVDAYSACVGLLPEGEARNKLAGALEWDEIEINRSHVDALLPALNGVVSSLDDCQWVRTFIRCLREIMMEPALYLMLKMRR